jgi:hypothetical protein
VKSRYQEIPEELRELPHWVVWRLEKRANKSGVVKETKVPYNARSKKHAKSNNPTTWSDFSEAVAALELGYSGLGFCLSPPYVGVDLDGCRPNGTDEPWAGEIIAELDSYTELSPSAHGVHVIVKGELPDGPRQKEYEGEHHGVGLYDAARGRYLTMTGCSIHGNGTIAERTPELKRIHARLFPPQPKRKSKAANAGAFLPDHDLIARASKANDGGKFSRLWNGQWESEYASQSEADLALCMKLAFWTQRDTARIDSLFRQSGLMRDKWERANYRDATIGRAIDQTTETWKPRGSSWSPTDSPLVLASAAVEPTIAVLNAMALFHGRLQFVSISRRGSMILASIAADRQIIFPTMTDLTSFARARAAIAEGADVLLPQPPRNQVSKIWDPAADLIIRLAAQDAIRVEHVLKVECKDLLILMWRYAKQPSATNSKQFMDFLITIGQSVRNKDKDAPPCVFIAEEHAWVHVPTFRNWLSMPALTNRLYPLSDIRQGLLLLGFEYLKDLTRGADGDSETASLWRGPVDVLLE